MAFGITSMKAVALALAGFSKAALGITSIKTAAQWLLGG